MRTPHGTRIGLACLAVGLAGCDPQEPPPQPPGIVIHNPYSEGGNWYRGNFHMHSIHSDGADFAQQRVATYMSGNIYGRYDVLAITDHDGYGDQDGGILDGRDTNTFGDKNQFVLPRFQVDDDSVHDWNGDGRTVPEFVWGSGAEAYVRDYDRDRPSWMVDRWTRNDGTVTNPPIIIPGFEGSYGGAFSSHFVLLGFPPGPVASSARDHFDRPRLEEDLDYLHEINPLGFAFIAHPRANDNTTLFSSILPVDKFDGMEIVNGLRLSMGAWVRDPDPFATPLWDALLSSGHALWGLANDDAHTAPGGCDAQPFTAFNMIQTVDATSEGFLRALRRGSFYASTGLFFDELEVHETTIVASVPGAKLLRFVGRNGEELAVIGTTQAARSGGGGGNHLPRRPQLRVGFFG